MKPTCTVAFRGAVMATLALPISAMVTLMLTPLWRSLEARTGLESLGHSGPAAWCYVVSYLLLLAAILVVSIGAIRARGAA